MLTQPSNVQASVLSVARQWIDKGQQYYANMDAGKYSPTIESCLQNKEWKKQQVELKITISHIDHWKKVKLLTCVLVIACLVRQKM